MIMETDNVNVINLTNYKKIIRLAAEKFSQVCFEDLSVELDRFMLWRHDVDIDLARASKIAEIDESAGFRSCFFLNISSEFYNIHDYKSQKILTQIFSLGHELGVHLDLRLTNPMSFLERLEYEAFVLEKLVGIQPVAVSFHNPPSKIIFEELKYHGLWNCYSQFFQENVEYCSDSNGHWRYKVLPELLQNSTSKRLQILTHPDWWIDDQNSLTPRQKVAQAVIRRAEQNMYDYDEILKQGSRFNKKSYIQRRDYYLEKKVSEFMVDVEDYYGML